jgi:hypothetical protein
MRRFELTPRFGAGHSPTPVPTADAVGYDLSPSGLGSAALARRANDHSPVREKVRMSVRTEELASGFACEVHFFSPSEHWECDTPTHSPATGRNIPEAPLA